MVSAGHYLATEAGAAMLASGGNAVDAAVAAGITLGVVHADQVQISGVAPLLIHMKERGDVVAISGLGTWPKATRPEVFVPNNRIPLGLLRTVVPAAPDAWILALERFGTMPFHEVVQPAIRAAREGFCVHQMMAEFIAQFQDQYRLWPQNAAIFLPGDKPPQIGQLFVQTDLAASLQYMADESEAAAAHGGRAAGLQAARAAFYTGDIARTMVRFHEENGGWLAMEDLANYRAEVEDAVFVEIGETRIYSCPPWCQGPTLLQMLRMVSRLGLPSLGHNSAGYVHTIAEAMKLCFADRHRWFGDPRFVDVPLDLLLSEEYATGQRKRIDPDHAYPEMPPPGVPGNMASSVIGAVPPVEGDTSYACAVDRWGNAVSATPSDTSYESQVIPGLGFVPSSRGSQSWADPTSPSSVQPGKRPRLTPNPSIAIREGEFVMPFGGPGGDLQPQAMLQVFLNHTMFDMPIQAAIEAPRFVTHSMPHTFEPHLYQPGRLDIESSIGLEVAEALSAKGHQVYMRPAVSTNVSGVCAIRADLRSGTLFGGADPRRAARAMGW
jgi:gamma-glutamyltranspeptidase/glutathione hydrolase